MTKKRCSDCEYRYALPKSNRCKVCQRKNKRRNSHNAHLKKTYDITMVDYDTMLLSQGGSCAICDGGTSKNHFAVDHDHKTGEVRGLLCARCNKVLGAMRDSQEWLHKAADYLGTPPARAVLGEREWVANQPGNRS